MEKTTAQAQGNGTIVVEDKASKDKAIVGQAKRAAKLHTEALADQPEALRTKAAIKAASRVIFAALAGEKL